MPASGNAGRAQQLRVLVVDDDTRIRRGLRQMMEFAEGVAVVGEAASLNVALQLDVRLQPDVVVVDVLLPEAADGLHVIAELARRQRPAIAISVDAGLSADALAAGAQIFRAKGPQVITGLLAAIRNSAAGALPDPPGYVK